MQKAAGSGDSRLRWFASAVLLAACMAISAPAGAAGQPVAVVESGGESSKLAPFELLTEGQRIALSGDEELVISYFESCSRESITGGSVIVGRTASTLNGGTVEAHTYKCVISTLNLSPDEQSSAAFVLRGPPTGDPIADLAKFVSPTELPLILAVGADSVELVDLRDASRHWTVPTKGGIADLAAVSGPLKDRGVYRVTAGERSVVFRIANTASNAEFPLLKRLLPL
jgi:hypothetical protein